MAMCNEETKWSSTLNCQTITRNAIQHLGFRFQSDISVAGDCLPSAVNIYLSARLTTVQTQEQTKKTTEKI